MDGWVCRNHTDCQWIDPHLICDDRQFTLTEVKGAWPWKTELTGRCACTNNFLFDSTNGKCYNLGLSGAWIAKIVVLSLFGTQAMLCCIWYNLVSAKIIKNSVCTTIKFVQQKCNNKSLLNNASL